MTFDLGGIEWLPVIVGVSAPNARESAILAEHAGSLGAAAVVLMPTPGASYDETAARDAWALVIGFFNDKL